MKQGLIILFLLVISTPWLVSFQIPVQETNARSRMQSLYIYNFASRYIEWPPSFKEGNFVIGIYGETPLFNEITATTESKKIFNQPIEIVRFNSPEEITKCNIIFIPFNKSDSFSDVMKQMNGSGTLIITEKEGVLKLGSFINFVSSDNKLTFELNKTLMQKQGLKVASELEKLAILAI